MKINEDLIQKAEEAVKAEKIVDEQNFYSNEFSGYISSFGAAIIQSGLLPAVIFFEAKNEQAVERPKIIAAIVRIIKQGNRSLTIPLSRYILQHRNEPDFEKNLLREITEAATAIKLVLRMFKKKGKEV
ncbi:MAG: type III-B CRISPR module-associated protein Cmr5 [Odoribacter splanchnicus]